MNNSAQEAFNLPTYLYSAHKLHDATVCAHTFSYSHILLHSPILKPVHYHNCPFTISDRSFLFPSVCDTSDYLDEGLAGTGCEGQCRLPGPLINWPLESTRTSIYIDCGQVGKGYRVSYQKAVLLQIFVCWAINLAVSELSFEVYFALSSPFSLFILTAWGCEEERVAGHSEVSTNTPLI